jgi:predicted transcriptional regulator of viral defense system
VAIAHLVPAAAVRRAGWILEHHTDSGPLTELRAVAGAMATAPSRLAPHLPARTGLDKAWNLYVNTDLDVEA